MIASVRMTEQAGRRSPRSTRCVPASTNLDVVATMMAINQVGRYAYINAVS